MARNKFNALPGFNLTLGFTMFYLSVIVLIPMAGLFFRVSEAGWRSQAFVHKDFKNALFLGETIHAQENPVSQFVWAQFPENTRSVLSEPQDPDTIPDEAREAEVELALRNGLNAIVNGPLIYDAARFEGINLGDEAKRLLEKSPGRTTRLNRLLLEAAYGDSLQHRESFYDYWQLATSRRAMAAYRLTFGASFFAAIANVVFGTLLAWVLVRYEFPGRRIIDAMVDFPFALPTAVAGLTLASLFAPNGWLGQFLTPLGIHGAYTRLGVVIALTFVGMPFVVRTLQPVLEAFEREVEEAAATLGAGRLRTFVSVIAPTLLPSMITGFALAFARAIGEYGSIVFISGNKIFETEIAPYLIVLRLEGFDYTGAIALAVVLLVFSFVLLAVINVLEQWASRFHN